MITPPKRKLMRPVDLVVILFGLFAFLLLGIHFLTSSFPSTTGKEMNTQMPSDMIAPSVVAIDGSWKTTAENGEAQILLTGNMYQIVFIQTPNNPVRRYTRGFFTYDEKVGKLSLTPDLRAGAPDPVPDVVYKTMTTEPFDVYVFKKKFATEIFWSPPQEMIESRRIHPLFYYMTTDDPHVLTWTPMPTEMKL